MKPIRRSFQDFLNNGETVEEPAVDDASCREKEVHEGSSEESDENRSAHFICVTSESGNKYPHEEELIWLSWKKLHVSVVPTTNGQVGNNSQCILDAVTGFAEPGRILAIMGPSGSGKSTLLDSLSGRLAQNAVQSGEVWINGRKRKPSRDSFAYVTQEDTLLGTLTVRESIAFSAQLRLPRSMSWSEKSEIVDRTIAEMGLEECSETPIGNWHMRGLSGGEKRRVSIATEILTRPRLLFLDEPTSGLDSASAFFVVKTLQSLARDHGRTVLSSIHQPSSEVFELFDQLCLLSNGKTVYFGEASEACKHFEQSGFPCPPMRNPSDHFLRAINSDFDQTKTIMRTTSELKDVDICDPIETLESSKVVEILVKFYKTSAAALNTATKVQEISNMERMTPEVHGNKAPNMLSQSITLMHRSFINMHRDMGYYWLRLVIYVMVSLCIGTIYFNVGTQYNSIMARASCMSYVSGFLTFMAIGGFPSFVEDMKVFSREHLNSHYGVMAFVIANTFSSLPFLFLISLVSTVICYFMVWLHPGFGHFLYFLLCLFAGMVVVESLMMAIAAIIPNYLMGIITGAGIQGIYLLVAGFFRLPNDLPKPLWKYPMFYLSFHSYSLQGMYQNDFLGMSFSTKESHKPSIPGSTIVKEFFQINMAWSKWANLSALFGMAIGYRLLFFFLLKFKVKLHQPYFIRKTSKYGSELAGYLCFTGQKSVRPVLCSPRCKMDCGTIQGTELNVVNED